MKREEITALVGEIAIALVDDPGTDADRANRQAVVALTVDVLDNLGRLAAAAERMAAALESLMVGNG